MRLGSCAYRGIVNETRTATRAAEVKRVCFIVLPLAVTVDPSNGSIDFARVERLAEEHRPFSFDEAELRVYRLAHDVLGLRVGRELGATRRASPLRHREDQGPCNALAARFRGHIEALEVSNRRR